MTNFEKFCKKNKIENAVLFCGNEENGFRVIAHNFPMGDVLLVAIQSIFENSTKSAHETGEVLANNLPDYIRDVARQYEEAEVEKD